MTTDSVVESDTPTCNFNLPIVYQNPGNRPTVSPTLSTVASADDQCPFSDWASIDRSREYLPSELLTKMTGQELCRTSWGLDIYAAIQLGTASEDSVTNYKQIICTTFPGGLPTSDICQFQWSFCKFPNDPLCQCWYDDILTQECETAT